MCSATSRSTAGRPPSMLSCWRGLGKDMAEVEKAVYAEIDRLKAEPVADWELEKVRMRTGGKPRSDCKARCSALMRSVKWPSTITTRTSSTRGSLKIQNVNKEDLQRVAKTYLTEDNRTVITTLPKPRAEVTAQAGN